MLLISLKAAWRVEYELLYPEQGNQNTTMSVCPVPYILNPIWIVLYPNR